MSLRPLTALVLVLGLLFALFAFPTFTALSAGTIIVNGPGDTLHSPGCATIGTGTCSLRDAITFANSNGGADTITNATISGNTAPAGGDINNANGNALLKNTIAALNLSGDCLNNGTLTANKYNIDSYGSCGEATTKSASELALDPLKNNGGPTQTILIHPFSRTNDKCPSTRFAASRRITRLHAPIVGHAAL